MKRVMMDGYVTEGNEKRVVDGVEVEIVTYQGEHCDEYLVREVKSGRCSLFYKGIIQLSWKEVNRVKVGGFTVYEKGKALRSEDWKGLSGREHRCIENCKNGLELVIEGNGVVYRGGFDDVESMKREGRENVSVLNRNPVYEGGYVFDEEKRVFLRNGYGCEIEGGVGVKEGV